VKAADVWNWDSPKETVQRKRNYPGKQMMSGEGRLSWISLKVLLYDDLVGVVTSRHVTKMAVRHSIRHCQTPCYTQTSRLYHV